MRISKTSLIAGTALLGLVFSLSTQGQSVSDFDGSASMIGVQTVSVLSVDRHEQDHDHDHGDLEEAEKAAQAAANDSQLRTAARSRAYARAVQKSVVPQQRLLAALDKPDIETNHKLIANEALMALPSKCRNTLQSFYVRYKKPEHRGLAGKSVMILDGTVDDPEFRALFVHESGHNWDLGCLTGTAASGKSTYSDGDEAIYKDDPSLGFYEISWLTSKVQKSNARPEDFVSGYASYNIFEDFAESFAYFVLQNDQFAKRAKTNAALAKKYTWLRDVLFDGNIPQIATGTSAWKGKVPWDITKLSYNWHPINTIAKK